MVKHTLNRKFLLPSGEGQDEGREKNSLYIQQFDPLSLSLSRKERENCSSFVLNQFEISDVF